MKAIYRLDTEISNDGVVNVAQVNPPAILKHGDRVRVNALAVGEDGAIRRREFTVRFDKGSEEDAPAFALESQRTLPIGVSEE